MDTPPASIRGICCTTLQSVRMNSGTNTSPNWKQPASIATRRWPRRASPTGIVTDTIQPDRRDDAVQQTSIREYAKGTSAMSKTHFGFQTVDEQEKAQK